MNCRIGAFSSEGKLFFTLEDGNNYCVVDHREVHRLPECPMKDYILHQLTNEQLQWMVATGFAIKC